MSAWFTIVDMGAVGKNWMKCWCKVPHPWYSVKSVSRYCRVLTIELEYSSIGCMSRVGA